MAVIVDAVVASASPTAPASSSIGPSADPITVSLSIEAGRSHDPPLLVHRGERRSAELLGARSLSTQALSSGSRRSVTQAGIAAYRVFPGRKRRCLSAHRPPRSAAPTGCAAQVTGPLPNRGSVA